MIDLIAFENGCRFSRSSVRSLALAAFLIFGGAAGRAQVTTATFYGSVVDPTGAAVAGASITLTQEETGAVTTRSGLAAGGGTTAAGKGAGAGLATVGGGCV